MVTLTILSRYTTSLTTDENYELVEELTSLPVPACTSIPETISRFSSIQEVNYTPGNASSGNAASSSRISFHQLPVTTTQCSEPFHSLSGGGPAAFERAGKAHSSARFASSSNSSCCRVADGKLVDIDGLSSQQLRQSCGHFHSPRPVSWLPFDR